MQKKRIIKIINKNFNKIMFIATLTVIVIIANIIIVFASNVENNINNNMENIISTESTINPTTESLENLSTEIFFVTTIKPDETEISEPPITEPKETFINLGKFRLTAYCPCCKCCGKWGINRPLDANGSAIVVTASGEYAKENWTVAADTNVLPFGTRIYINGFEYEVQDRGVTGRSIDIYFNDHEDALNFGVQYAEILQKTEL